MIGYLSGRSHDAEESMRAPILAALEEAGFDVGRNVTIEYRFAEGREERLPASAVHCRFGRDRRSRTEEGLFDHCVGASEQRARHGEFEGLRCCEVDDNLVFGWRLHR